ncbi:unnamed protein product [Scytosiphon promiscuus]
MCWQDFAPFTAAGKAVLDAEFGLQDLSVCNDTRWSSIDFIVKGYELDDRRCSCGFPETDLECQSLLLANTPTASMTDSGFDSDTDGGGGGGDGDGDGEDEGTPTWVIVTIIALIVLILMMVYGAVVWRRWIVSRRKVGGVDDFFGEVPGDRQGARRAD